VKRRSGNGRRRKINKSRGDNFINDSSSFLACHLLNFTFCYANSTLVSNYAIPQTSCCFLARESLPGDSITIYALPEKS
jgi:hypothetical protein